MPVLTKMREDNMPPEPQRIVARTAEERSSRTLELRREIALSRIAEGELNEIDRQIAALENSKEELAAGHIERCTPIQSALKEIEAAQIEAINRREEVPREPERRELLAELNNANDDLESAIKSADEAIEKLQRLRTETSRRVNEPVLTNELFVFANPTLKARMKAAQAGIEWCERRVQAAEESQKFYPSETNEIALQAAQEALARETAVFEEAKQQILTI